MAQVLAFYSVLGIAEGDLQMISDGESILKYSAIKTSFFKVVRKLFHSFGCVTRITQHLHKQEMVSHCIR
jgi:hypothetical protein